MKLIPFAVALSIPTVAIAQSSLLEPDVPLAPVVEPVPNANLRGVSLMLVVPPEPREYAIHDIITIVVDESTKAEANQELETKKDYDIAGALGSFPSLNAFSDGRLDTSGGDGTPITEWELAAAERLKGEGDYTREDTFTARITAEIIDVKPNGVLVLEARTRVEKDDEIQTIVLAGRCRSEDVTDRNTILSSQLADMHLAMTNEGEVKKAGSKGYIPRVLEAIFNF